MPNQTPAGRRPWQATLILSLFVVAVAAAAFIGWRFARESPPHQGPIVVIAVSTAGEAPRVAGPNTSAPVGGSGSAIEALTRDAIVFNRAYTHSLLTVPALASLLTGQLPLEHGVRDDAGFVLPESARTLPELLRGRGFATGGAASTVLLAAPSGLAQGFSFYDAEMAPVTATPLTTAAPATAAPVVPAAADGGTTPAPPTTSAPPGAPATRTGEQTLAAAEQWVRMQDSQRYFLYLEVDRSSADRVVGRLIDQLKAKQLYDGATIVVTEDHGVVRPDGALDDNALRVRLLFKQPYAEGAGRRIDVPVQQIDLLPTVLDFVRAPIPGGLRGRSLRPLLDDDDATIPESAIYSESLEGAYRLGGLPVYALTTATGRLVRASQDAVEPLGSGPAPADLPARLDALLKNQALPAPAPIRARDEQRFAAAGYGQGLRQWAPPAAPLDLASQARLLFGYRQALAVLGGHDVAGAIAGFRALLQSQPALASVQFQLGSLLARSGYPGEALAALREADTLRPDDAEVAVALADAALRARDLPEAKRFAEAAVTRSTSADAPARVAARLVSMQVALAERDYETAAMQAAEGQAADPSLPLTDVVKGRTAFDEARHDEAITAFQAAAAALKAGDRRLPDLQYYLGESLAQVQRYADGEVAYRDELQNYPDNARAWAGLALLYQASGREQEAADTLDRLIEAVPTADGYAAAARAWTQMGNRSRAEAVRADARRRFRPGPTGVARAPRAR